MDLTRMSTVRRQSLLRGLSAAQPRQRQNAAAQQAKGYDRRSEHVAGLDLSSGICGMSKVDIAPLTL